ncbi:MAG: PilZ domain-containing protein [Chromatiales bacterium]
MEHRYYPRMQVSLEVDLFKRDRLLGSAKTKDISLGGMMLQNDTPQLNRNDLVAIRIWVNGVEQVMRGLVIHTDKKYAGVMLIDMNKDVSRAFFDFLREMRAPLKSALAASSKGPPY